MKILVSHFTNPNGLYVHQVSVNGMPAIAETEDETFAWRTAREIASGKGMFRGRGAKWEMQEWNGDTGELREVESGRTAA